MYAVFLQSYITSTTLFVVCNLLILRFIGTAYTGPSIRRHALSIVPPKSGIELYSTFPVSHAVVCYQKHKNHVTHTRCVNTFFMRDHTRRTLSSTKGPYS